MHRRGTLALVLVLFTPLAFAGCLGGGAAETVDTASSPTGEPSDAAPPAASASEAAPAAESGAMEAEMAPMRVETPVLWNGELSTGACVPAGVNSCMMPFAVGSSSWYKFLDVEGAPQEATLTLTWTSRAPHEDSMHFALVAAEGSPGSWSGKGIASVDGPSPLVLDASGLELPDGHSLVLVVRPSPLVPSPAYGWVETGLAFSAEGTVVSLVTPLH